MLPCELCAPAFSEAWSDRRRSAFIETGYTAYWTIKAFRSPNSHEGRRRSLPVKACLPRRAGRWRARTPLAALHSPLTVLCDLSSSTWRQARTYHSHAASAGMFIRPAQVYRAQGDGAEAGGRVCGCISHHRFRRVQVGGVLNYSWRRGSHSWPEASSTCMSLASLELRSGLSAS